MTQQITIQPPHDDLAGLEYDKGGRFRLSGRGAIALLIIITLLMLAFWLLDQML